MLEWYSAVSEEVGVGRHIRAQVVVLTISLSTIQRPEWQEGTPLPCIEEGVWVPSNEYVVDLFSQTISQFVMRGNRHENNIVVFDLVKEREAPDTFQALLVNIICFF